MSETSPKKIKLSENQPESSPNPTTILSAVQRRKTQPDIIPEPSTDQPHCHFWVKRKSRYCKMTLKAGAKYCGEHSIESSQQVIDEKRILCPLDPTHSIYRHNLNKHLKICNAKKLQVEAPYVQKGLNAGCTEEVVDEPFRLRDVPQAEIERITKIVEELFEKLVDGKILKAVKSHKVLDEEIQKDGYGAEKLRHLIQTSSILGILKESELLTNETCYVDLGAGKGNLSYWLSMALTHEQLQNSKVLVVDRASHRHKRDNLVKDLGLVDRLRVDIADLDMTQLDFGPCKTIVGVSKHLCGRATDYALRCLINANKGTVQSRAFLICVCCHHQISYDSFLGRDWMSANGIDRKTFGIIIKMVSWCICGDGRSREQHKEAGAVCDEKTKGREIVGWKCKRLLDYARAEYMNGNRYETKLCYYVEKEQTLENVCIFGRLKE